MSQAVLRASRTCFRTADEVRLIDDRDALDEEACVVDPDTAVDLIETHQTKRLEMALDDNIELVRELQQTGNHLARLAGYMSIGLQPSRENIVNAQRWFNEASTRLEPVLQEAEADKASQRMRQAFRG